MALKFSIISACVYYGSLIVCLFSFVQCDVFRPRIDDINDGYEYIMEPDQSHSFLCEGNKPLKWTRPIVEMEDPNYNYTTFNFEDSQPKTEGYKYASTLHITNITYQYVGFYYCHEKDAEITDARKSVKMYIYVDDINHLAQSYQESHYMEVDKGEQVHIPCIPTSPRVDVTVEPHLHNTYDPKTGFTIYNVDLSENIEIICNFTRNAIFFEKYFYLEQNSIIDNLPEPYVTEESGGHTVVGEDLVLKCAVRDVTDNIDISWQFPTRIPEDRINKTRSRDEGEFHYSTLRISNTELQYTGNYTCRISTHKNTNSNSYTKFVKVYGKTDHFINLYEENGVYTINIIAGDPIATWKIDVDAHPTPNLTWLDNKNNIILKTSSKYIIEDKATESILKILDISIEDFGKYTLVAENQFENKSLELFLNVTDKPTLHIEIDDFHMINTAGIVKCIVAAYPEPNIFWRYKPCQNDQCEEVQIPTNEVVQHGQQYITNITIDSKQSGLVSCYANNSIGMDESVSGYYVSDIEDGFNIFNIGESIQLNEAKTEAVVAVGDTITMTCGASSSNYTEKILWFKDNQLIKPTEVNNDSGIELEESSTEYSHRVKLVISNVNMTYHPGIYKCKTTKYNGEALTKEIRYNVSNPVPPSITETNLGNNINVDLYKRLNLYCYVSGIPKPTITWYKNDMVFQTTDARITVSENNQVITFNSTALADEGTFACEAQNNNGTTRMVSSLVLTNKPPLLNLVTKCILIGFSVLLIILIIGIVVAHRNGKKLKKELRLAGLANFENGEIENLNPELGIDDQAELLPYDKKWEFPIERLKLGKQLGSGAFGVVLKGEAKNIIDGEETTTVAVKKVKRNADHMFIKALASELKIMVHLGQHLNVVNLLGACTKNVAKRELLVIVEFCRFGNLHNYLLRHRGNFINQLVGGTGKVDYNIGQEILERAYSVSSNRSNPQSPSLKYAALSFSNTSNMNPSANNMADYRGEMSSYTGATQRTEMTTSGTSADEDGMVLSNNSSIQPDWRSNYKGDYKDNVRPICTKDLLVWAFQVARGMEYLASRKILHGDLAARNILLADNNIVKICDFGLAKTMYKDNNYKKKGDGPLPIKWMAVESIRDHVFSTESDVWSFGIVLWEFFSLARTPYPGMEADERFYNKLVNGYRMECPQFAPDEMYKMMTDCWDAKPLARPCFTRLAERIGSMLEEAIRNHYIDLNDPYLVMNTRRIEEGQNDYLAMLSPPTFEVLSSPIDPYMPETETGYLPMKPNTIFSPRLEDDTVFDFAIHNRKNLTSAEGTGKEMLPILHTVNESDSDTPMCQSPMTPTGFSNPSYHLAPKIADESEKKVKRDIVRSTDNYVNMPKNKSAIKESDEETLNIDNSKITYSKQPERLYVNDSSRDWESINV